MELKEIISPHLEPWLDQTEKLWEVRPENCPWLPVYQDCVSNNIIVIVIATPCTTTQCNIVVVLHTKENTAGKYDFRQYLRYNWHFITTSWRLNNHKIEFKWFSLLFFLLYKSKHLVSFHPLTPTPRLHWLPKWEKEIDRGVIFWSFQMYFCVTWKLIWLLII